MTGEPDQFVKGGLVREREQMVASLLLHIQDERVLAALAALPREDFVSPELRRQAYENRPLPIGHGQTTSQPLMIALMLQELGLEGPERVLEIGSGSGYQTALLSRLAGEVTAVELIPSLAGLARRVLRQLGCTNVELQVAIEELGWPSKAPFDAIIVAAAAPRVPMSLVDQLASPGKLVIPVGDLAGQDLMVVEKADGNLSLTNKGRCSFVPLLGRDAFAASRTSRR